MSPPCSGNTIPGGRGRGAHGMSVLLRSRRRQAGVPDLRGDGGRHHRGHGVLLVGQQLHRHLRPVRAARRHRPCRRVLGALPALPGAPRTASHAGGPISDRCSAAFTTVARSQSRPPTLAKLPRDLRTKGASALQSRAGCRPVPKCHRKWGCCLRTPCITCGRGCCAVVIFQASTGSNPEARLCRTAHDLARDVHLQYR